MALRTNFLAVLTKSPLRTGGVNVMAGQGKEGTLLIEQQECGYSGVVALFARPFYALGAFSERQCKYHKAPKAGIYWGVLLVCPVNNPLPCLCQSRRKGLHIEFLSRIQSHKVYFYKFQDLKKKMCICSTTADFDLSKHENATMDD